MATHAKKREQTATQERPDRSGTQDHLLLYLRPLSLSAPEKTAEICPIFSGLLRTPLCVFQAYELQCSSKFVVMCDMYASLRWEQVRHEWQQVHREDSRRWLRRLMLSINILSAAGFGSSNLPAPVLLISDHSFPLCSPGFPFHFHLCSLFSCCPRFRTTYAFSALMLAISAIYEKQSGSRQIFSDLRVHSRADAYATLCQSEAQRRHNPSFGLDLAIPISSH